MAAQLFYKGTIWQFHLLDFIWIIEAIFCWKMLRKSISHYHRFITHFQSLRHPVYIFHKFNNIPVLVMKTTIEKYNVALIYEIFQKWLTRESNLKANLTVPLQPWSNSYVRCRVSSFEITNGLSPNIKYITLNNWCSRELPIKKIFLLVNLSQRTLLTFILLRALSLNLKCRCCTLDMSQHPYLTFCRNPHNSLCFSPLFQLP